MSFGRLCVAAALFSSLIFCVPAFADDSGQIGEPGATRMWGGFYGGLNGAYGSGDQNWGPGSFVDPAAAEYAGNGTMAGVTAGFNIDHGGRWIVGLEADYDWADLEGELTLPARTCVNTCRYSSRLDELGTVRGRIGYDIGRVMGSDGLMLFGTGGVAFGEASFSAISTGFASWQASRSFVGWTIGLGGEYAVDRHWSAKLEYLHVDLGNATCVFGIVPPPGTFSRGCGIGGTDLVRVGINYKP